MERTEGESAALGRRLRLPLSGLFYGWVIVLGGFVLLYSGYGVQFSFGVFLSDMEASLAPGHRAALTLGFSIYAAMYSVFSLATGIATDRWGPRPVVLLGALLFGGSLLWVSRAGSLWEFYVAYGLLAALAMSTCIIPATSTVVKWFVARRGLAVGIVTAGVGAGQLTVPILSALALVPLGWRTAYLVYAVALFVIFAAVGLLMERDPESRGLLPYGAERTPPPANISGPAPAQDDSFTLGETLRSLPFWMATVSLGMVWSMVFLPFVHLPPFAQEELGLSAQAASLTITTMAVGSLLSRLFGGLVSDMIGLRATMGLSIFFQGVSFAVLWWTALAGSPALLYLGALVFGLGYGAVAGLYAVLLADLFGRRFASSISGALFALAGSASGIGVYMAGLFYESTGGYQGAFALGALVSFLALPLFLMVRRPQRRHAPAAVPS
jgi:OFA family oxalate/formate antiporter-like MFS transporter